MIQKFSTDIFREQAFRLTQFTIDKISEAIFWVERDARYFYVNDIACRSLGYTRAELLTMTVHDIDPNITKEMWPGCWEELSQKQSFTIESIHRRKDGSIFPVEVSLNYLQFEGKEYNCVIARDITQRQETEQRQEQLIKELQDALAEIKTLKGIIPICSACKKIRDDQGYWNQLETYIRDHSDAEFTHGLCPDCAAEYYSKFLNRELDCKLK